jgi:hypothetical protein
LKYCQERAAWKRQVKELRKQWLAEIQQQKRDERAHAETVKQEIARLQELRSADKQHDREKHQLERLLWEAERAVECVSTLLLRVLLVCMFLLLCLLFCHCGLHLARGNGVCCVAAARQPVGVTVKRLATQPRCVTLLFGVHMCCVHVLQAERRLQAARREEWRQQTMQKYRQLW